MHTPLPWRWDERLNLILDETGEAIAENILLTHPKGYVVVNDPERQANAQYIITACNHHERLVQALEMMVEASNVKEIDPLVMFASIERAKQVLSEVNHVNV